MAMLPQNIKSFVRSSFRKKKETKSVDCATKKEKSIEVDRKSIENEEEKLTEMKQIIGSKIMPRYTDKNLLGFLKARSYDVDEAVKLYGLDVNYRKLLRIENMLEDYEIPEINHSINLSGTIGFDKEGSLVRILNPGNFDFKGYMQCVSTIDLLKTVIWFLEHDIQTQEEENEKASRNVEGVVIILNLENIHMNYFMYKPALDTMLMGVKLLRDHYHEAIKTVFIVNVPSFFSSIIKLFKPVLDDTLMKRLRILEGGGWKQELMKYISIDNLPVHFGGVRVDGNNDPKCAEFIGYGGMVPKHFYPASDIFLNAKDPDVLTANVPAGSFLNFRFPIESIGTKATWYIQAKDNDIGIGLFSEPFELENVNVNTDKKKRVEDMSKLVQLTPIIRSQCHLIPEIGTTICWMTGNMVMHLDNTYSWMNSKDVYFKIVIEPPTILEKNDPSAECQLIRNINLSSK